jgi:segregation and condensation protein A
MPISLELHAESVRRHLSRAGQATFAELVGAVPSPEVVVVTLLAVLELYKRGLVDVAQEDTFGDIVVTHLSEAEAAGRGIVEEGEDD